MMPKLFFIFLTGPSNSESISQALLYFSVLFLSPQCLLMEDPSLKITIKLHASQRLLLSLTPLNTLRVRMENSWRRPRAAMNVNGMSEHCRVKIDRKLSVGHWVMRTLSVMNPNRAVMKLLLKQRENDWLTLWYSMCNCDILLFGKELLYIVHPHTELYNET